LNPHDASCSHGRRNEAEDETGEDSRAAEESAPAVPIENATQLNALIIDLGIGGGNDTHSNAILGKRYPHGE
tara:strand:- start:4369 stop:4584 length:216 start_codon:yes stop_codon:yes gene_type:complete